MKTMLVGLLSAVLALVCYTIYDAVNNRWLKRKNFLRTALSLNFPEEIASYIWKTTGFKARQLMTYNKKGEETLASGLEVFGLDEPRLAELSKGLPAEYLTFVTEFDKKKQSAGIIKSKDKFAILKTMQTQSARYNLSTGRLIAELRSLDKKESFTINGAGQDWVELYYDKLPEDPELVLAEVKELCPEVSASPSWQEDFRSTRKLFLWWPEAKEAEGAGGENND